MKNTLAFDDQNETYDTKTWPFKSNVKTVFLVSTPSLNNAICRKNNSIKNELILKFLVHIILEKLYIRRF